MAGPVVEFTEDERYKLAKFVGITHWTCVLPSFVCLLVALYIQILIEDKISFIENYNGAILPGFLVFAGFFGLFTHILCGKVAFSNRVPEKREKWMAFLLPAVIATAVVFLAEFISGIMCFAHIKNLEESFNDGINVAMAAYKNDATTKEEMDILQMTYECCGSRSYTDWFYMAWVHPDYVNPPKPNIGLANSGVNIVNDDAPFSCCSPHVLRPCIHHHVHDNDLHFNYDYRTSTTIHTTGCTAKLMAYYGDSVLTIAGAIVLSLSFIQLILTICFRFLQTTIISVMSSSDQGGPSTGYLFTGPQTTKGNDTTMTSTEADTLLNTTTEVSFSQDDDEFGQERYTSIDEPSMEPTFSQGDDGFGQERYTSIDEPSNEPMYENIPPFHPDDTFQNENDAEHIYNEGDVEEYLATKFANSREMFESLPSPDYNLIGEPLPTPDGEPIYVNINPSTTGSQYRSRPSLTKVRSDYGNYMAMNISNSSRSPQIYRQTVKQPQRRRKHHKDSHMSNHKMLSPYYRTSSPKDTYVINMAQKLSPKRKRSLSGHRHPSPEHRRLLETNYRDRSPIREKSPHKIFSYHARPSRLNESQRSSQQKMTSNRQAASLPVSPIMLAAFGKRRSPKKGRSPKRRVSPQKTSFRTGVSYECNHAYD